MKKRWLTLTLLCLVSYPAFCGGRSESHFPTADVVENDNRTITDDDILKAFEAEPQIAFPLRVSWYNLGSDDLLKSVTIDDYEVISSYVIPKTLIEGFVGSEAPAFSRHPTTLNLKSIRLAAARARTDIVVIVGSTYNEKRGTNLLAIFNMLLFPILFNPAFSLTAQYSAEMYVIDVRNGYLYGQFSHESEETTFSFLTISKQLELAERNRKQLIASAGQSFSKSLTDLFALYMEPANQNEALNVY